MVASAYVHLPFCRGRCPYCDFVSNDLEEIPLAAYAGALAAELRWRTSLPGGAGPFGTVYLGGGTPSLLPAAWIAGVLRALPVAPGAEVTVEANPGDADATWFEALVAAGVTRFSVGVQATDGERLRWLGRRHGVDEAAHALRLARAAGARSVSADLIYGTPGQTPEGAAAEARALAEIGADHVSAYELTVAPRTPLGRRAAAGDLDLPGEEALIALWDAVGEALAGLGLERYEISSFARPGQRCRHNEGTWRGGVYAGLGSGAHGHLAKGAGWLRYANDPRIDGYLDAALSGRFPADGGGLGEGAIDDPVDAGARAAELVLLGLRWTDGIDLEELARLEDPARVAAFATALAAEGYARITGGRLVPTREGMLLADDLAARL